MTETKLYRLPEKTADVPASEWLPPLSALCQPHFVDERDYPDKHGWIVQKYRRWLAKVRRKK